MHETATNPNISYIKKTKKNISVVSISFCGSQTIERIQTMKVQLIKFN